MMSNLRISVGESNSKVDFITEVCILGLLGMSPLFLITGYKQIDNGIG